MRPWGGTLSVSRLATLLLNGNRPSEEKRMEEDDRKSLKRQKKEYRDEKKRVTKELVSALRDPTVVVMADWLKVRGKLRKWSRYYCVLKPGLMIIYKTNKTNKHGHWVGTILLNTCELIERPSKKDGFCFKLYQPLDQSIWATRGPLGESPPLFSIQHLPSSYLICRAASEQAGRCWMDALELSLRCTGLLMRTMHKLDDKRVEEQSELNSEVPENRENEAESEGEVEMDPTGEVNKNYSETEAEKHFDGIDDAEVDEGDVSDNAEATSDWIESEKEVIQTIGAKSQTEEVAEDNKSLLWTLLKQIRPGMDLSKVVLPTFILEPRSFLEKLADYYYHADLLSEAVAEPDPLQRIVKVARFYLSGFYKKPKGLKKPYNPILGETFRCCWKHPDGSTTFYMAEQVSHHPPISSLFITNRKAGFNISGTILAKSKFYGNSLSAIMEGSLKLTLLNRGETYTVTLPSANCKGIMIGTMTMELNGPVTIECDKTGYSCQLDFHLKPFMSGSMNRISGKVRYGREELATMEGYWDSKVKIRYGKQGSDCILWEPTQEVINSRLPRYEIDFDSQDPFESKKLWCKVTEAINNEDQVKATEEKTVLEEEQRKRAKSSIGHKTKYFKQKGDVYEYIYAEYRPWDSHNDVEQIENNYIISTKCRVKQPTKTTMVQNLSEACSEESSDNETETPRKKKSSVYSNDLVDLRSSVQNLADRLESTTRRLENSMYTSVQEAVPSLQTVLLLISVFIVLQAILIAFLVQKLSK